MCVWERVKSGTAKRVLELVFNIFWFRCPLRNLRKVINFHPDNCTYTKMHIILEGYEILRGSLWTPGLEQLIEWLVKGKFDGQLLRRIHSALLRHYA